VEWLFQAIPLFFRMEGHFRHHSQKSATSNQKIFFQVQTRRLAESFEGLNSSLAQLAE